MQFSKQRVVIMDLNRIVKGLSSSGAVSGFAGGLAGSALVGAISGKKGKKMAKGALKVGALAAVGGLAYKAYQGYRQNQAPGQSQPSDTGFWQNISEQRFEAVTHDPQGSGSLLLLRAMIAAAASDGHVDGDEQNRVFEEAGKLDLSQAEKARLFDELQNPLGLQQIVAEVNNPETAVEVYAASLIAIDESRPEGQTYLRSLALALDLPAELVDSVHQQVATAQHEAVAA